MNAIMLIVGAGVMPPVGLTITAGNGIAAVLCTLLLVCVAALWSQRERPAHAPRRTPRSRPAAPRPVNRLTPVPRPLS